MRQDTKGLLRGWLVQRASLWLTGDRQGGSLHIPPPLDRCMSCPLACPACRYELIQAGQPAELLALSNDAAFRSFKVG